MSVIRVKKEEKYAVISNEILTNKNLSWEARGVMAYLLSKPNGWQCRNYDLVNQGPAGKHVIQRVISELQEAGYIHRYQVSDGHTIEWITEIYETPELNTAFRNTDFPPAEEPTGGRAAGGKPGHIVSTDDSKYLLQVNTDTNMPQSGASVILNNDLTDIVRSQSSGDKDTSADLDFKLPEPSNGNSQPQELSEGDKAHLLTFGVLPAVNTDPQEYAVKQEIINSGWEIHSPDVELGIVHFILAVRVHHSSFKIPGDTGTRKDWYRSVNAHLANYSLADLPALYKRAIIKMREKNLSFWRPGALSKWALPEVVNAPSTTTTSDYRNDPQYQAFAALDKDFNDE